ncbi:hypothetical protein M422DRAFT_29032 [Sphaerobolus stellatus SS14]|uniref:Uncharacterized protein n=1 Tax=Sphaerobolus stellatus (strain SS14) TaxID=990650 RepID=A0A0C9VVN1_SPHS4|nr:hypothetical protein M422DRAFT_29032 [Sphaerobolus stellatus SS14]
MNMNMKMNMDPTGFHLDVHIPYGAPAAVAVNTGNILQPSTNTIHTKAKNTVQTPMKAPSQSGMLHSSSTPRVHGSRSTLMPKTRTHELFQKPKKRTTSRIEEVRKRLLQARERVAKYERLLVKLALKYAEGRLESGAENDGLSVLAISEEAKVLSSTTDGLQEESETEPDSDLDCSNHPRQASLPAAVHAVQEESETELESDIEASNQTGQAGVSTAVQEESETEPESDFECSSFLGNASKTTKRVKQVRYELSGLFSPFYYTSVIFFPGDEFSGFSGV